VTEQRERRERGSESTDEWFHNQRLLFAPESHSVSSLAARRRSRERREQEELVEILDSIARAGLLGDGDEHTAS
jgi:hypothetical protein